MTDKDNILRLAENHAICTAADMKEFDHAGLFAFVAALKAEAVEETREACAKLCHDHYVFRAAGGFPREASTARACAAAILSMAATPIRESEV